MRIISGTAARRRIRQCRSKTLRPTTQKVKEALFAILGEGIENATFLDLFAGVGAMGIEALSRGASFSTFVEQDPRAVRVIKQNLQELGMTGRTRIIRGDCLDALDRLSGKFDYIFLDPPYGRRLLEEVLRILAEKDLLRPRGVIVAEHHHKDRIPERLLQLRLKESRRYGETMLSFYAHETGE